MDKNQKRISYVLGMLILCTMEADAIAIKNHDNTVLEENEGVDENDTSMDKNQLSFTEKKPRSRSFFRRLGDARRSLKKSPKDKHSKDKHSKKQKKSEESNSILDINKVKPYGRPTSAWSSKVYSIPVSNAIAGSRIERLLLNAGANRNLEFSVSSVDPKDSIANNTIILNLVFKNPENTKSPAWRPEAIAHLTEDGKTLVVDSLQTIGDGDCIKCNLTLPPFIEVCPQGKAVFCRGRNLATTHPDPTLSQTSVFITEEKALEEGAKGTGIKKRSKFLGLF